MTSQSIIMTMIFSSFSIVIIMMMIPILVKSFTLFPPNPKSYPHYTYNTNNRFTRVTASTTTTTTSILRSTIAFVNVNHPQQSTTRSTVIRYKNELNDDDDMVVVDHVEVPTTVTTTVSKVSVTTTATPTTTTTTTENISVPTSSSSVVKNKARVSGIKVSSRRKKKLPSNVKAVTTLEEYKKLLDQSKVDDTIVVVRFYASWCKACKAIESSFYRLARKQSHITFLEVPVTSQTSDLHQGLNVPSIPYGHVYYPNMMNDNKNVDDDVGLVEELKMSKKHWTTFEKVLMTYSEGYCTIDIDREMSPVVVDGKEEEEDSWNYYLNPHVKITEENEEDEEVLPF